MSFKAHVMTGIVLNVVPGFLQEDLKLIGAERADFTQHGWRNLAIGSAHENPAIPRDAIAASSSHSVHNDSYDGCGLA